MSIKIDKYILKVYPGQCQIVDRSCYEDRTVLTFTFKNNETNKKFAELCLKELNTGKYEESNDTED